MQKIKSLFKININNEIKRKKFLVFLFSFTALIPLTMFGVGGLMSGKIVYSTYIFIFWIITFSNIVFLYFSNKVDISAHIIILLMFVFSIIIFTFLGVGVAGLFWFYIFSTLAISLTNYKRGAIYSLFFLLTSLSIYLFFPELLTNSYTPSLMLRFVVSYIILNILFITIEYSREETQKHLKKALSDLEKTNDELTIYDNEQKLKNDELFLVNKKLKENEKRLSLAQKTGRIGTWEWNVKTGDVIWTDITYDIFGKENTGKKLKYEEFLNYIYYKDKDRILKELDLAIKNNIKIHKTEYRIIKEDKIHFIDATSEIIKDKKGSLIHMIGVLQDITERKNTEKEIKHKNKQLSAKTEELKQNNEVLINAHEKIASQYKLLEETIKKYDLLANYMSDFIWMLSFDVEPLYISPSCKKFLGYTIEEIKSFGLAKIHTKEFQLKIKKLIENTVEIRNNPDAAKGITTEIEYIHKDGHIIIAEVMAYLIYDKNNKAIAIGGISRDITRRKQTELELEESNKKIASAHKDILDNLRYAKKIQDALLSKIELIDKLFNNYFLIFEQKFSVGGDFYYVNKVKNQIIFAVGDCTGHGISGGFLSMIAITYLHEIAKTGNAENTGKTLDLIRQRFKKTYKTFGSNNPDGFNISLCNVDSKTNIMKYSGAYHPLIIIRNNELIEYKASRNPIGFHYNETNFQTIEIQLQKNDKIYLFSDGYYDQINPEGKKIGKKQFKNIITENSSLSFKDQEVIFRDYFNNWQQEQEQIDDVTFLGINWEA